MDLPQVVCSSHRRGEREEGGDPAPPPLGASSARDFAGSSSRPRQRRSAREGEAPGRGCVGSLRKDPTERAVGEAASA
ncbi:hypothetical protein NDU88_002156 [Pleurodeles waltl]|uniref:Uncharacterized protein n=1 Tax=Pleurodeles waltl TaxID=8319 RepID=A0AAV7LDD8_PLEWA|nr:hypothetical protein NDU88_002156 [Pleurodeles waltl]